MIRGWLNKGLPVLSVGGYDPRGVLFRVGVLMGRVIGVVRGCGGVVGCR